MIFDVRECFFFDCSHDNVVPLRARSIEHQEREASVAGDEAEFVYVRSQLFFAVSRSDFTDLAMAQLTK